MANRFREDGLGENDRSAGNRKTGAGIKRKHEHSGRTRDLLAEIIETSPAQVGRYKAIYNNIIQN